MRSFGIVEMFIAFAALVTFVVVILAATDGSVTVGINGFVENRCINGMQFVIDDRGRATQVMKKCLTLLAP